ncbi:hypothetical protein [Achromobacter agilis]|uniref:hypothetical protein n=1 Tax=Achromobacter agilis TaxID=1353888 RepID=UPI0010132EDC|nr:hypothetical protein [Achromobacter agilis]
MHAKRHYGHAPERRKAGSTELALRTTQPHGFGRFTSFTRNTAALGSRPGWLYAVQHAQSGCDDHGSDYDHIHRQILLCN